MEEYIEEIDKCIGCKTCNSKCPTFNISNNELEAPDVRIQIARKVFSGEEISENEYNALFSCTKCEKCDLYCEAEIQISKIIGQARNQLFKSGHEMLSGHSNLRDGILKLKNSTKGDHEHLLDYLPENFENDEDATTLYYAGCLPGYFLKNISTTAVQILKKIGIKFKVIKDEICCGSPLLDVGDIENAKKFFNENLKIFEENNVKNLIVSCTGCYRAFKEMYPELIGKTIPVKHIIEVIAEAVKDKKIKFKKSDKKVIYHDPCHYGREFKKYEEPRIVLQEAFKTLVEFDNNRDDSDCCGADSAARAGFKNLATKVALKRIDDAVNKADILTTTCPFCTFNLSYARRKNERPIDVQYITEIILDLIE
ncbi:MAG: (Fe-S)-binding protein [Candidatus Helarchaeota archaeon]